MIIRKQLVALLVGTAAVLSTAACGTSTSPSPTATPGLAAPQPAPSASLTRNPPEPDSMLWIRAIATAANGASLSLEAMVHRPLSYAYPGSQTMNTIMIDDCGATLTNAILTANSWSLTRMNTTAIPPTELGPDWPSDAKIYLRPSAKSTYMSARGMILSDATTGGLACNQDKYFVGAGKGAFVAGIPGDTIDLDHFHNGWSQRTWGFTAPSGVTLSNCSFEMTDLANQYGVGNAGWIEVKDPHNCYVGPANELPVY